MGRKKIDGGREDLGTNLKSNLRHGRGGKKSIKKRERQAPGWKGRKCNEN